jgi:hypothetical protein
MKFIMLFSSFVAGSLATLVASSLIAQSKSPVPIPVYEYLPQESLEQLPPPELPPVIEETISPQETKSTPARNNSFIRVVKTKDVVSQTKDPIWKVELVVNDKVVESMDALIGRSYRQHVNRHTAGNKSPLPIGSYRIDTSGIALPPFNDPELGTGYWIPITPMFSTGRSALGIHQDPSWGKLNGESGTSGCIGLKTEKETYTFVNWIRQYNIRNLIVES